MSLLCFGSSSGRHLMNSWTTRYRPVRSLSLSKSAGSSFAAQVTRGPPAVSRILNDIFDGRWRDVLRSVEIGHHLRRWSNTHRGLIALYVQTIVSCIVANAPKRDEHWPTLAMDQLSVSVGVL